MKRILYILMSIVTLTAVVCLAAPQVGVPLPKAKTPQNKWQKKAPKAQVTPRLDYVPIEKRYTVNGVSFVMVEVRGGTFMMGATAEQGSDAYANEWPVHRVTVGDYYIGKTEVTEGLWRAVMGSNPSSNKKGDNYPVQNVSWEDCQTFISKLNALTGETFRLPTEAEWEFAARGGTMSRGYKYSGSNTLSDVAWYDVNAQEVGWNSPNFGKHPVAMKYPNELGLYDMSGNIAEETSDTYFIRGGSWVESTRNCRVSFRINSGLCDLIGLRLAR